jgi:2-polyprenyl-3-methyl-5-hydroxy-6-metoxy-1,4-benzoquinol methylase
MRCNMNETIKMFSSFLVQCPLCSESESEFLFMDSDHRFGYQEKYGVYACPKCYSAFVYPRPDQDRLRELYRMYYVDSVSENTYRIASSQFKLRLFSLYKSFRNDNFLKMVIKNSRCGKLLEFGCGEGLNLAILRQSGFDVCGFDTNQDAIRKVCDIGIRTCSIHEQILKESPFDIVLLPQVIEHLCYLEEDLGFIKKILKPDGALYISTPNYHSIYRKLFGTYWIHWHIPFHLQLFSCYSLLSILEKAGFKLQKKIFYTPIDWMVRSFVSWYHSFGKSGKSVFTRKYLPLVIVLNPFIRFFDKAFPKYADCIALCMRKAG